MKKIILASGSPRRKELLAQIGLSFEVIPSKGEEKITKKDPARVVEELSAQKAEEVAENIADGIIIGADTVVSQDGLIMGKPADRKDAEKMLKKLEGRSHSVFTGVMLILKESGKILKKENFSVETKVHVYPMSDQDVESYLDMGEYADKAGAYGIQGAFAAYISGIEGDYNNVVGLPVGALYQKIKEII